MASSVKPFDASEPAFGAIDAGTAAALLAVGGDIALVIDAAGVVRDVALPSGETQLATSSEWVGRPWADTVSGDTRLKVDALLREAASSGISKRRQVNHALNTGGDVPVAYTALRIGRAGDIVAVGRDMRHVSALQQRLVEAQQAMERDYWRLRHVETRYRLLFQLASDGILVLDASNLKVLDANHAASQIFGDPSEQLIGRTFPFGVDAEGARAIEDLLATARSAGRGGDITVRLLEGRRPFHVSASCFRQEAATLLLVRLSAVESAGTAVAAESATRVVDLIERSPDGFVVTDLEGHILMANRAFLDITELDQRGTDPRHAAEHLHRPTGCRFPGVPLHAAQERRGAAHRRPRPVACTARRPKWRCRPCGCRKARSRASASRCGTSAAGWPAAPRAPAT